MSRNGGRRDDATQGTGQAARQAALAPAGEGDAAQPGPSYRRLSDPRELQALAHPVRIGIIELLSVSGPLTATELADRLDESPANCSWHLRKLARFGFVEEAERATGRQRPWRVPGIGLTWTDEGGATAEERRAAAALDQITMGRAM